MTELREYAKFTSDNPRLDFTFLFPSAWQVREVTGRDYDEVFILGPVNREGTYSLALIVRRSPARAIAGRYASLRELLADYLAQTQRSANFREISQAQGTLAGVDAIEIEVGYSMPLPLNSLKPKETQILERRILLQRDGYSYEIVYRGADEDYYRYLDVFKNMVRTFELHDDTAPRLYRPLVEPVPVGVTDAGS